MLYDIAVYEVRYADVDVCLLEGLCVRSYILAIVLTMFLSALFAFQNIGDVTVKFLFFEWTMPQGVWEVVLFSSGAALMWFFSLFSVFEVRSKLKKELKVKDDKISSLEQEKKAIIESLAARQRTAQEDAPQNEATPSDTAGTAE